MNLFFFFFFFFFQIGLSWEHIPECYQPDSDASVDPCGLHDNDPGLIFQRRAIKFRQQYHGEQWQQEKKAAETYTDTDLLTTTQDEEDQEERNRHAWRKHSFLVSGQEIVIAANSSLE